MTDRISVSLLKHPVYFLALGFGAGLLPRAPGTAGTVIALLPAWWMLGYSWPVRLAGVAALFALGVWVCGKTALRLGYHDHPVIVFDEIVGYLASCLVLPANPVWLILAFVLFRFFDIVKPWPVGYLDQKLRGGFGIMLDDFVAAVYTTACILLVSRFYPFIIGTG